MNKAMILKNVAIFKWINAKEQQPTPEHDVLCACRDIECEEDFYAVGFFSISNIWFHSTEYCKLNVEYWAEIPERPE